MNLYAEHYGPVRLAILALFGLGTATQRRQISADDTKRGEILCGSVTSYN